MQTIASLKQVLQRANMMSGDAKILEFSLVGGPLHRLGSRLGLVIKGINTVPLGLAFALITWGVLMALVLIEGGGEKIISVSSFSEHARLLIAIPLFFICETLVIPRMAEFVSLVIDSEIVPEDALPEMELVIANIVRWKDSWLPEIACLLASILMFRLPVIADGLVYSGIMPNSEMMHAIDAIMLSAKWYWLVCLPLYRFLLLRWLWLLFLWIYFLWRLSRMHLHLIPTHPDGAGGLGFLEVVHQNFALLILALSSVLSASFAEKISRGVIPFEGIYPVIGFSFILFAALFLCPLLTFSLQLRACKIRGWNDYSRMGAQCVNSFEKKWLSPVKDRHHNEVLLGSSDLKSLMEMNNNLGLVRNTRLAAISKRLIVRLAAATLLPFLPLLLFIYPVKDLIRLLLKMVLGI